MAPFDEHQPQFHNLLAFLAQVPGIETNDSPYGGFGSGAGPEIWWVKLSISIDHPLAWNVVQEMGHVLNLVSINERLPTVFKPVSPPPYMNGGPRNFLSWVIECPLNGMTPYLVAQWLESRMPRPVDDIAMWTDLDEE